MRPQETEHPKSNKDVNLVIERLRKIQINLLLDSHDYTAMKISKAIEHLHHATRKYIL